MGIQAEIIAIGNELLLGNVLDTNSHWLCGQLSGLGASVRRVCLVRDDPQAIGVEVRGALSRDTRLLVTTGGLGPTDDDLTLQSIARALGLELRLHRGALGWVRAKYEELARQGYVASSTMTPSRLKMARLPLGAEPLANQVGAAPGVVLKSGACTIVSLPGVPAELKGIFQGALRPILIDLLGEGFFLEWRATIDCGDESVLAPVLRDVAAAHQQVYIKSHARRFAADEQFTLMISARGKGQDEAESLLRAAWQALERALSGIHVRVLSVERTR